MTDRIHRRLRTPAAADYLGLSASALDKKRLAGDGPSFIRLGRTVVYDTRDLDTWLAARRAMSTRDGQSPQEHSSRDRVEPTVAGHPATPLAGKASPFNPERWGARNKIRNFPADSDASAASRETMIEPIGIHEAIVGTYDFGDDFCGPTGPCDFIRDLIEADMPGGWVAAEIVGRHCAPDPDDLAPVLEAADAVIIRRNANDDASRAAATMAQAGNRVLLLEACSECFGDRPIPSAVVDALM
jgi:predicted DNA-binding transcriptional regulator AlpA